jgi:regulatory protein YycI of two-component signal transduction system YycFG
MIPYAISIKYMLAGFIAIFLIIAIYLVSLFVRWRRLKRDFQNLEEVENLDK